MKPRDEKLDKLERVLKEAHQAQPEVPVSETWRRTVMADIHRRASAPAPAGASELLAAFQGVWRLAPALATVSLILFVCVWISLFGAFDGLALTMLTGVQGGLELSAAIF